MPDSGFEGIDSFTYYVTDGGTGQSGEATVTITVVPAPVVVADSFALSEDSTFTVVVPGVLLNDTDIALPIDLQAELVNNPENGGVTLSVDGGFSYTPDPDYFGVDTFEYRAIDPITGGYATGIVTLNVKSGE